jgi:hypothetical protein
MELICFCADFRVANKDYPILWPVFFPAGFFPMHVHELTHVKGVGLDRAGPWGRRRRSYSTRQKKRLGTVTGQGFEEAAFANTD